MSLKSWHPPAFIRCICLLAFLHVFAWSYSVIYDNTYILSAATPTLITFDYLGVDTVMFAGSGGTHHSGYTASGKQFALAGTMLRMRMRSSSPGASKGMHDFALQP